MADGWIEAVQEAVASREPLSIRGHGSKTRLFGPPAQGLVIDTTQWRGIVSHQPAELVVTVRTGTPLAELEATLAEQGQQLAFDPPQLGGKGTVGGAVAAGLSGPSRPWSGACRDALLGVKLINGEGQLLTFGGQVLKNVAGYDVSRLQCGALGQLGILSEVSLRVTPKPVADQSFNKAMSAADALQLMRQWCRLPLPLAGLCYLDGKLWWRLSGHAEAVNDARSKLGGEPVGDEFWCALRDMQLPYFEAQDLWRLFVAPATQVEAHHEVIDWAGALRWSNAGYASKGGVPVGTAPTASGPLKQISQRLKTAFDPHSLFNTGARLANPTA